MGFFMRVYRTWQVAVALMMVLSWLFVCTSEASARIRKCRQHRAGSCGKPTPHKNHFRSHR